MLRTENICVRDPFIVVHEGVYYLYSSTDEEDVQKHIYVYRSRDLLEWEEPKIVFTMPVDEAFWGVKDLWATEVHRYQGKYYAFVSIMGKHGLRGTQIAVSDTPDGEFRIITNHPATPMGRSCIDGSLYVEEGTPYIVYSFDWPDNYLADRDVYVGEIWAVQLTEDLKNMVGEPFKLFSSDEAPCSAVAPSVHGWEGKTIRRYGSDAPFVQRLEDGSLFLTWSPIPAGNYIVGAAVSKSGKIRGDWEHIPEPIFDKNGGHAMFFRDLEGRHKMCIHQPERWLQERAVFLDVEESEGIIRVK